MFKGMCQIICCVALLGAPLLAQAPIPRMVESQGRHALLVDGEPYLILGAQVHNSSAWPSQMPKVWPAIEALNANTVEVPIYWEQLEPRPGVFDFSLVDLLLRQARERQIRLGLLWFGTWKNGSGHYWPEWMKTNEKEYPHVQGADGKLVDSPSPFAPATLKADIRAFSALMQHLKEVDAQRTVIFVQVENEPGTWGSVRDFAPAAQKVFEAPVPDSLLKALRQQAKAGGDWKTVFGPDADEFFHAWAVARYIEQVAAAGKAIYPLPLTVNAALRGPFNPGRPPSYESGGPTDNVLDLWKAVAPSIDILAPDIYQPASRNYNKILDYYSRSDNALFVPETGNTPEYSRYFFAVLGHQGIGFSPFGMDFSGYENAPLGAGRVDLEALAPFALNYKLVGPMQREIAKLSFAGKVRGVSEEQDTHAQTFEFGTWKVRVAYGLGQFGFGDNPPGNKELKGRALVAQLGENEYIVTGAFARVEFLPLVNGKQRQYLKVEEGVYQNGVFQVSRIWNGDQTDWGLNFKGEPQVLRVRLAMY